MKADGMIITIDEIKNGVDPVGKIINADCTEAMEYLKDDSVNLIVLDPPYNIGKAKWDKIKNYIDWMGLVFMGCQRTLKDSGSVYCFHNDMPAINRLMIWIEENTKFVFKQFIVWNKRFKEAKNKGFLDGFIETNQLRNYQKMAEYILFYTFQDDTGLTQVMLEVNNFSTLRQYFKNFQEALGLNKKQIIKKVGQRADHCFRWNSSQWDLPTKETYQELCKLPINNESVRQEYEELRQEYEELRQEYEELRQEYEELRYTFNNQKTHHSIWDYEFADKKGHLTPKPVELIENIIKHSTNKNDIICDPFAGSGTTAIACIRQNRQFILIEQSLEYCQLSEKRIKAEQAQGRLF